jgi:alkanesulfonate monooxygenase SsuD/methylene tetrahydromethanopterin reductase-like flavin-dependent oxidoreductase (luciferase family)
MNEQNPQFGLTLSNRGIVTGESTVEELLALARQAEETGWDSVWVGDSIFAKPRLDALVLLGALAATTRRVKLGAASLTSTPLRNALQLAYQWASLDCLSHGRMIFNASQGAPGPFGGGFAAEYATFGLDPATRMRRMEEAIEILRLTSTQEQVSYEGTYNQFHGITILPRPVQQPLPIWISTATDPRKPQMQERALRRVAKYADGWMTISRTPDLLAANLADVRRYAQEEGRPLPDPFTVCLYLDINVNDDRDVAFQESKRFLDQYYTHDFSRPELERRTIFGPPQTCIASLRQFMQAGATAFTLRIIGSAKPQQFARLTQEVLPAFA